MRGLVLMVALMFASGAAFSQDRAQTLADIRAELATLNAEFTALKQELVTTRLIPHSAWPVPPEYPPTFGRGPARMQPQTQTSTPP